MLASSGGDAQAVGAGVTTGFNVIQVPQRIVSADIQQLLIAVGPNSHSCSAEGPQSLICEHQDCWMAFESMNWSMRAVAGRAG